MRLLWSLLLVGLYVVFWFLLFRKAGHPKATAIAMALGMCVPLVNLVLAYHLVTGPWPIEERLAALEGRYDAPELTEAGAYALLAKASALEARGDAAAALALYQTIVNQCPGTAVARDAETSIRLLKGRTGPGEISMSI